MPNPGLLTPDAIDAPPQELRRAEILDTALSANDLVRCVIPDFDPSLATDPMPWMPFVTTAGAVYPRKGDIAMVGIPTDGPPVIVQWAPTPPYTPKTIGDGSSVLDLRADFGCDGKGKDDTTRITEAIEAQEVEGLPIFAPAGEYLAADLTWDGHLAMFGVGPASILKTVPGLEGGGSLLVADSGSEDPADNKGLTLRSMQLRGRSDTEGFSEQQHLLRLVGISDVLIDRDVILRAFKGDGVYLGGTEIGGEDERHNERVTILATFDGAGRDNRNCVSVIDGTTVYIGGYMTDAVADNMPGAVDIEPNNNAYHRVRDIEVAATIDGCGGNVGDVCFDCQVPQATLTTDAQGFHLHPRTRNSLNSTSGIFLRQKQEPTGATPSNLIDLTGADIGSSLGAPIYAEGVTGVKADSGYLGPADAALAFGYHYPVRDIHLKMHLHEIGKVNGIVAEIYDVHDLSLEDGPVEDCGTGEEEGGLLVWFADDGFVTPESSGIELIDLKVIGKTLGAIAEKAAGHTTDKLAATGPNMVRGNRWGESEMYVPGELFAGDGSSQSHVPQIAAASKLVIPADVVICHVTGTTEITEIEPMEPGRKIVLRFESGPCKVAFGGNLNLNGKSFESKSGGSWDYLELTSLGNEFIETGRHEG